MVTANREIADLFRIKREIDIGSYIDGIKENIVSLPNINFELWVD